MRLKTSELVIGKCYRVLRDSDDDRADRPPVWIVTHKGHSKTRELEVRGITAGFPDNDTVLNRNCFWEEVSAYDEPLTHTDEPVRAKGYRRSDILRMAEKAVMVDRADDHGGLEDNFRQIAAIWSIRTGVDITPHQAALMMVDLKVVRSWTNPKHVDNYVDIAGYGACAGDLRDVT